ncbi:hypothetical protein GY12_00070 [Micrococcus luteus]|nr:hypothetical protein GY12_00070 [Micrococcus luteus]
MLSTTSSAPASWAICAQAARSAMPSSGLEGVSTHSSAVRPGRTAAATAVGSVMSTGVLDTPHGSRTVVMRRWVPP